MCPSLDLFSCVAETSLPSVGLCSSYQASTSGLSWSVSLAPRTFEISHYLLGLSRPVGITRIPIQSSWGRTGLASRVAIYSACSGPASSLFVVQEDGCGCQSVCRLCFEKARHSTFSTSSEPDRECHKETQMAKTTARRGLGSVCTAPWVLGKHEAVQCKLGKPLLGPRHTEED